MTFHRSHRMALGVWLVVPGLQVLAALVIGVTVHPFAGLAAGVGALALQRWITPPRAFWAGGAPHRLAGTTLTIRGLCREREVDLRQVTVAAIGGSSGDHAAWGARWIVLDHPDGAPVDRDVLRRLQIPEGELDVLAARLGRALVVPLAGGRHAEAVLALGTVLCRPRRRPVGRSAAPSSPGAPGPDATGRPRGGVDDGGRRIGTFAATQQRSGGAGLATRPPGYLAQVTPGGADFPAVPLVRTDLAEPTVADRYELRSVLGSGGMGTVWEAYDIRLDRTVALKVLRDDLPPSAALQLEREARAAARILDPRVVTVLDLARTADGNPYLVLECHGGHTLADELRDGGPLSPERLDRLVEDLLGALAAAHRCDVLHRDVKPANVLSGDDGYRVTDFGLASLDNDQSTETDLMGTLVYVAPERLDGARGSTRSDVFSAAVVIHEAATGVQPFRRQQPVESIAALRTGDAPPLPDWVPERLRDTLHRAMSPDPDGRPEDAAAMLAPIRSGASGTPGGRSHDPPRRHLGAAARSTPHAATVAVPAVDHVPPPDEAAATTAVPHHTTTEVPLAASAGRPAPVRPGPLDGVRRSVARHGRRPEVVIGLVAALLVLLLLLTVAFDGNGGGAPVTADAGRDVPATLDQTLDRIEELGR